MLKQNALNNGQVDNVGHTSWQRWNQFRMNTDSSEQFKVIISFKHFET